MVKTKKKPGRPKKKHPGGRPTVFTEKVLQKLEEAFLWGCSDIEACFHAGISESSLYNYQEENEGFLERKKALKENTTVQARKTVLAGVQYDPDLAFRFLSKKKSEEFTEKKKLVHEVDGGGVNFNVHVIKPGGQNA